MRFLTDAALADSHCDAVGASSRMEAVMEYDEYWEHQRPSWRKTVCAWAIVAVLALVFGSIELMWPSRSAPLGLVTANVEAGAKTRAEARGARTRRGTASTGREEEVLQLGIRDQG